MSSSDSGASVLGLAPRETEHSRLNYVLDNVVAFVGALTPSGILTEANEPALQAAALTREDVVGKPFWDCYWWNHDTAVQERLRDAVRRAANGHTVRYDAEIRVANNRRMIIDFQLSPHFGPDGIVDELIPSGVDITSHKLSEQAANEARDTFQRLVQNSPFGIYAVDADFRLSLVSQGAQKAFANVRPLIGRDFVEVMHTLWPDSFATEAVARFRHTLATGEPYHGPSLVERRNDIAATEAYDWKIERLMLPDGRYGVVCHFYDLSEREQHAAALRASEARFRATFENAAVGIAHVAPDGRWLRVNQKLRSIVGYGQDELAEMRFQDITHADDLPADLALLDRVVRGEIEDYDMEKRYLRKDGSSVWVNLTVSCVRGENGDVQYFIAVVEDIEAHKAAQQHQALLVNELNHRVKNSLATVQAMASHTLRNAKSPEAFRDAFSGRLRAIAAAHDSIFAQGAGRAELKTLVNRQLSAFGVEGSERLSLQGAGILLSAEQAHGLGLIFHELATNAAKYGALSQESGKINIDWSGSTSRDVQLTWTETGGPPVLAPEQTGFGSRLIETTLELSLGGRVEMDYRPEGLRATLTFPSAESQIDE